MAIYKKIKKITCPECGYSMGEKYFKQRHKNSKKCKLHQKSNSTK